MLDRETEKLNAERKNPQYSHFNEKREKIKSTEIVSPSLTTHQLKKYEITGDNLIRDTLCNEQAASIHQSIIC